MAAQFYIRTTNAEFKKAKELYIHDGTQWRQITEGYVYDGSSWRQIFSVTSAPVSLSGPLRPTSVSSAGTYVVSYPANPNNSFDNTEPVVDVTTSGEWRVSGQPADSNTVIWTWTGTAPPSPPPTPPTPTPAPTAAPTPAPTAPPTPAPTAAPTPAPTPAPTAPPTPAPTPAPTSGRPTIFTNDANIVWVNSANTTDVGYNDTTTYGGPGIPPANTQPYVYMAWPSQTTSSATLYLQYGFIGVSLEDAFAQATLGYSTNGGSTYTTIDSSDTDAGNSGPTAYSVGLPSGINLNQIKVRFQYHRTSGTLLTRATCSAICYDAWIDFTV